MTVHIHTLTSEQAARFQDEDRRDPLTREPFSASQRVVVCRQCRVVSLHATWQSLGEQCVNCKGKGTQPELPAAQSLKLQKRPNRGTFRPQQETQPSPTPPLQSPPQWPRIALLGALIALAVAVWLGSGSSPSPDLLPSNVQSAAPQFQPPPSGLIFEVTMFKEEWKRVHASLFQSDLPVSDPAATDPSDSTRKAIAMYQFRNGERPTGYQTYRQTLRILPGFQPRERPKGVSICNRTGTVVWIAVGLHNNGRVDTSGWYEVAIDTCRHIVNKRVNKYVYLAAVNMSHRRVEYGDVWLCGEEVRSFNYNYTNTCRSSDGNLLKYHQVEFGSLDGVRVSVFQID